VMKPVTQLMLGGAVVQRQWLVVTERAARRIVRVNVHHIGNGSNRRAGTCCLR